MRPLLLPVAGLINGLLLDYGYRRGSVPGDDVVAAVHQRSGWMPLHTALIKPVAAIVTLACGGSAGREGPCVHIGATLASALAQALRLDSESRRQLVLCAVGAAFTSVFGAPVAGAVYGTEMMTMGQLQYDALFPTLVASVTSYQVSRSLGISYSAYPIPTAIGLQGGLWAQGIVLGLLCGLISWLFITSCESVSATCLRLQRRWSLWPPVLPLAGGALLALLSLVLPNDALGLSLPLMDRALQGDVVGSLDFFWKLLFVSITLGSGFYGGIATPQLVIGAAAGDTLGRLFHISPALGAAVGAMAVLASASNTPLTAIAMGFELFGAPAGVYTCTAALAAYLVVGHRSVYGNQVVAGSKSRWLAVQPGVPVNQQQVRMAGRGAEARFRLDPDQEAQDISST
ncbi:MAG: chloride channel protein [Alicyclobacillus macrosporangiidus]|uniref:chloride channel protein n=1 Tax=Alicyclobacillus macrosporangiidus TaxID=392015 RepID=UPI0026F29589|nr:chloride channel protein [Alicyclobacillus macrosporangiidus]MCL6599281.1 chloride channel protein [Alicyclobacillus macrosporangiidus]